MKPYSEEKQITAKARLLAMQPQYDGKSWAEVFELAAREIIPNARERNRVLIAIAAAKNFKRVGTDNIPDPRQGDLFPSPDFIDVEHPTRGPMLLDSDSDYCSNEMVDAWEKQKRRHHDIQFQRFDRRQTYREKATGTGLLIPENTPWRTAKKMLNTHLSDIVQIDESGDDGTT